jgi:hypothetical protein
MAESHRVARTFLKGFARKVGGYRGLVVYDKHGDLAAQVQAQQLTDVKEASTKTNFYRFVRPNGPDDAIEEALSKIESVWDNFATVLRTPGASLAHGQLGTLAAIAGIWEARSARSVQGMKIYFERKFEQARAEYRALGLSEGDIEAAVVRFVNDEIAPNAVATSANLAVAPTREMANINYQILRRMHIAVLTSNARGFFTSDHPVAWVDPHNGRSDYPCPVKLGPNVEVTFPLSKSKCLLFAYQPIVAEAIADDNVVDIINCRTTIVALDEIYAPPALDVDERAAQLRNLTDHRDCFKPLSTRFTDPSEKPVNTYTVAAALTLELSAN